MAVKQPSDAFDACAQRLETALNKIFAGVERLSGAFQELWLQHSECLASRDLAALRPLIDEQLTHVCAGIQGAGVIVEPGVLYDKGLHSEWRYLSQSGRILPLGMDFNQRSESYYDYRAMPWFSGPRSTGTKTIVGPYIDLYGQETYVLTFACPLLIDGQFMGVAGADIALNGVKPFLISSLLRLPDEALLLCAEGRVIASTSANWKVGDIAQHLINQPLANRRIGSIGTGKHWTLVQAPRRQLFGAA